MCVRVRLKVLSAVLRFHSELIANEFTRLKPVAELDTVIRLEVKTSQKTPFPHTSCILSNDAVVSRCRFRETTLVVEAVGADCREKRERTPTLKCLSKQQQQAAIEESFRSRALNFEQANFSLTFLRVVQPRVLRYCFWQLSYR